MPPTTVIEGDALVLNAPDGVTDQQAQARRDRADARRAERDRRRAAERELRKERDAQRDAARQEERRRLLREKKARKQAEREARARAAGAIIPTRRTAKTRRNAAPVAAAPVQRAAPIKPQARVAAAAPVVQPRAAAPPPIPTKKAPPPMKKAITVPQEVLEGEFYWQHTDGEQRGPSTWKEYKQAHASGETNAELLVYCADVADEWKAAQEVPQLMAYVEAPDAPAPKPPKPPPVPRMLAVPAAREPEPEPASEFEAWDGDPDSIVAAAPAPQPEPEPASAEVRSEVSDLTDNTPAPVAASAPVRQAPVVAQAPATKLKFKKRAGDDQAGTFKIDIMAAVFGSCKCGKLKADHIGPDLKCPPC